MNFITNNFAVFNSSSSESMRINSSGNVGIGTTLPGEKLHVAGNIRVGDSTDTIYSNRFKGINNADVELRANNGYDLILNGSSGDNVGIGASNPLAKLQINGENAGGVLDALLLINKSTTAGTSTKLKFVNSTDAAAAPNTNYINSVRNAGSDNDLIFGTSNSDRMTIDSAGNVGIGTTTPGYPLDVQTTGSGDVINIEAAGTAGIRIANSNAPFATRITSSNTQTSFKSDGDIEFYTDGAASGSGTARMIIENSTGDVGIGTNPDIRLHVKDDVNTIAKFESTDEQGSQIIIKNAAASNNQAYLMLSTPTSTGKKRIALGGSNNANNKDLLKIENQVATNYTDANMSFGSTGVNAQNKFAVTYDYNTDQDTAFNGIFIDANILGTTAITGDKTLTGLNVDMDCNASGGNQAQELQLKGINVDVVNKESGDANHIYGVWARASSTRNGTGDNITDITGGYFEAKNSAQTGQVSNMYGTYSYVDIEDSTHTIGSAFGSFARVAVANAFDGTISTKVVGSRIVTFLDDTNDNITPLLIGADIENTIDSDLATSEGVRVVKDINTNLTITDSYLFKGTVEKPASSTITNNWGLYLDNIDKNYLQGTLRLPTYGQGNVTGTATKNLAVDSNGNVIETDGGVVDGSGTANYVPKWSDPNTLTDSQIFDNGTNVEIDTAGTTKIGDISAIADNGYLQLNGTDLGYYAGGSVRFLVQDDDNIGITENIYHIGDGDTKFGFVANDNFAITTAGSERVRVTSGGSVGIGTNNPVAKLQVSGGVQVADDVATATADRVGTLRYRTSGNNSYVDMCMQTGASTYAWVNIVQNNW